MPNSLREKVADSPYSSSFVFEKDMDYLLQGHDRRNLFVEFDDTQVPEVHW